ncbi:hypothetical protein L917_19507 [Phytophthora nicotianae]|uniref:Uncharacterized protein n=1 Tax=Phytophthora nicotianae TaxID=4792 RepID=W2K4A2_PHYNI|nr:hypothetical protein L917_19507 [Phytophthora nicotianae]
MEQQQIAQSAVSLAVDVKAEETQAEPEPQLDAAVGSPTDDASKSKKKKKKKKKNRRKSLEKVEVEELKADKSEPEEEEMTNQEEAAIEESAVVEVASVASETTVTNQTTVESAVTMETTMESTVTEASAEMEEASNEKETVQTEHNEDSNQKQESAMTDTVAEETLVENTVTEETTVESTVATDRIETEQASIEKETVEIEHHADSDQKQETTASDDELAPPNLERTSSLDTLKATGTKAVGSLFSRFKVGRKKPLPSRTDSAAQLELAVPSPVKTAVKKLEIPEEKNLDDLPMRTKRDFFGEGEQSIHVSAEKEKYDTLEKQRKTEKEAEEAAIAARRTPPPSSRSNSEVQAQLEAAKEQIQATSSMVEETTVTAETESTVVIDNTAEEVTDEVTTSTSEGTVEEEVKSDDVLIPASMDKDESTFGEEAPVTLETTDTIEQEATTEVEHGIMASVTETAVNTTTEVMQYSTDDMSKSTSQTLELDLEPRTATQSDVVSTENTEVLSVKITPPTSELPADTTPPAEPEKMSPVKSLASRFEGKREQSLDSLKFRTVREFFPTERSIRVGAEKQKYEAQAQQQQLKAKAEEEAKSKYKASVKSPVKEAAASELKTSESVAPATATETDGFTTPDGASSRKKMSFDEGYSSANSPSKFSDEALTPVKSIASRFEGKREQSLDSLKFRTVREFFPEERSVRVGSEKQKFEAQAQQDNSLDKLKFRTVREFFPEEGKRSVHVGAEKAKFEAITKQQEEAKAAELKLKHAAPQKSDSTEVSSVEATIDTSSDLGKAQDEVVTSAAATSELKDEDASTVENTVAVEADESLTTTIVGETSAEEEIGNASPSVDADAAVIKNEDTSAQSTESQVDDAKSTELVSPVTSEEIPMSEVIEGQQPVKDTEVSVAVGSDYIAASEEVEMEQPDEPQMSIVEAEVTKEEDVVDIEDTTNQDEPAVADIPEEPVSNGQISADIKQTETQESANDVVIDDLAESSVEASSALVNEVTVEPEKPQEPVGTVAEDTTTELVELDLGEQVQDDHTIDSSATATIESATTITEIDVLDVQQPTEAQEAAPENQPEVEKSASSGDNELVELDLGEPVVEPPSVHSNQGPNSRRAMLTTERSFVMEKDDTIEMEDTVVVGERPMTDGEDEFEPLSPTKRRPAHELYAGISSKKELKKKNSTPKLTRKVSVGSVGSAKSSSSKTTVPVPMKRASITAPTASYKAKKAAETEEHKASQLKKQGSASKLKASSPTVPIPMKRASITAPTASYKARKAAEEEAHQPSPQPKKSKKKGEVSETGFIKPPPAAPTVPVPMRRASITAPTASWQARNVSDQSTTDTAPKIHAKPSPTVPVPPRRASIMAPTASFKAKKTTEEVEAAAPARNKRYSNVKSKVLEGIQTGTTHTVTHKKITKEEFIAAERRKSLGSAGVRSVLDAVDRRASLTARATIDGPPEPFIRSAVSRKKLDSTMPRYLNYENAPGYAERARKQYERRKRLEEENAAKSEKRQRELRTFFNERQQKSMMSSAEEVRRGLEAHEFTQLVKESELEAQKALRRDKQRMRSTRSHNRAPSTTSATSSSGVASRTSKKSTVSSASVEEKVVAVPELESVVIEAEEVETTETIEVTKEIVTEQESVVETVQVQEQTIAVVDEDPELNHVAKKIDFDEASSDSERDVANE